MQTENFGRCRAVVKDDGNFTVLPLQLLLEFFHPGYEDSLCHPDVLRVVLDWQGVDVLETLRVVQLVLKTTDIPKKALTEIH